MSWVRQVIRKTDVGYVSIEQLWRLDDPQCPVTEDAEGFFQPRVKSVRSDENGEKTNENK